MILTDREIEIALGNRQLIIDPLPDPDSITSSAVDLCLRGDGLDWVALAEGFSIRPGHKDYKYSKAAQFQKVVSLDEFTIKTQSFVLGWTREKIQFPNTSRLAARIEGKSSLARLGIGVHVTAPTIHAGFGDPVPWPIQLEIFNFGPHDIILDAGMKICQLIIEQTFGTPNKGYRGQFRAQA